MHTGLKNIEIIDITHHIRLNNTIEAAFVCKQIQISENQDNIIITKVGSCKNLLVYQHLLNLYIFPNNGLLSMVFPNSNPDEVYMVENGEEVMAVNAFLNKKLNTLTKAGKDQILKYAKSAQIGNDMAVAEYIYSDGHGNCYFNITKDQFMDFTGSKTFQIRIQHYLGHSFTRIENHINDVDPGEALFRFSDSGYLKLQINLGNAQQLFRIKDDSKIIIDIQ